MFDTYTVDGPSMDHTLKQGQIVWTNKYHYDFFNPQRHDIVVIKDHEIPGGQMIKRIIALPGEEVELIMGWVFINGIPDEYDVDALDAEKYSPMLQFDNLDPYLLKENEYFYHGDNRVESVWGVIHRKDILGKVVIPFRKDYTFKGANR